MRTEAKDREKQNTHKADKSAALWLCAGIAAVLFMGIPYLLLGQEAIFTYHDQLDGEVIAYLLQARHLGDGSRTFAEFLNGAAKTALTPPAPACVLLYRIFPAHIALALMQVIGSLVGFLGMYLLLQRETARMDGIANRRGVRAFLAVCIGVMYAYLPFLPVYGLAQYGLPLLLYVVLCLGDPETARKQKIAAYVYIVIFGANSSLVLVGFAVLGIWLLWEIVAFCRKKRPGAQGIGFLLLLATYILENIGLLGQLSGAGSAATSHKAEYVLTPAAFFSRFWTNFTEGGQHSVDGHRIFWLFPVLLAVWGIFRMCRSSAKETGAEQKRRYRLLWLLCGSNVILAFAAALWDSAVGVALRNHLGALKGFQANRVLWLSPCLWYLALGIAVAMCVEVWFAVPSDRRFCKIGMTGVVLAAGVVTLITAGNILLESNLKPNLQKLRNSEYSAMSFADYYAIGVLDQVQDYIREELGEAPEDYRVVSLGIDPAAALYHGFYCLDGYSNNYSLEYKHCFREIIAPELAKSEYLADGFDGWGNRCYLFSAECPGYYTVEKGGFYFQNYDIDAESLYALGGRYLLSAAYIADSEETGLELVCPDAFETPESYYRIYLYRVMEEAD